MLAVILSIGDELVLGQTLDTNSAFLSAELASRGISTLYHQTVADDQPAIARAIDLAAESVELVIISGGIGPTDDDLTRHALAQVLGQPLVVHEPSLQWIEGFFTRRGRPMPDRNKVQALHPQGTEIIKNDQGTAPGIKVSFKRATIYVTPGVPHEMRVMFERSIAPNLAVGSHVILSTTLHSFGLGESDVAEQLGDLMRRDRNPKVGTTVANGICSVRVRSEFDDAQRAAAALDETVDLIRGALGPVVFGHDHQTIQQALISLLEEKQLTLTTAESCTGGLLGQMLTEVAGSSNVYVGGWVTYSNGMKKTQLGVPESLLQQHGAVSAEVAIAMARGAVERSSADLGVSVTGIAGPTGGSPEKPIGTVWVALVQRPGLAQPGPGMDARLLHLPGGRSAVRDRAAKAAIQLLRFHLLGVPLDDMTWTRRDVNQREPMPRSQRKSS